MSLSEIFLQTISDFRMLSPRDRLVVGVSGGPDSMALLHLLECSKKRWPISLVVAHLNHGLRGEEADQESRRVEDYCRERGIPVVIEKTDVARYASEHKQSIEDAGRNVRYDFFDRVAKEFSAKRIAVAHTADDVVETFLMRLLRGAGLKGLSGIPPVRGPIIRPLIRAWRSDVEAYVKEQRLPFSQDSSNQDLRFFRNEVRLNLLPILSAYNPRVKDALLQTADFLRQDEEWIRDKVERMLKRWVVSRTPDILQLKTVGLLAQNRLLQGMVLRVAIEDIKGNLEGVYFIHVNEIVQKLGLRKPFSLCLPGRTVAEYQRGILTLRRES